MKIGYQCVIIAPTPYFQSSNLHFTRERQFILRTHARIALIDNPFTSSAGSENENLTSFQEYFNSSNRNTRLTDKVFTMFSIYKIKFFASGTLSQRF